MDYEIIGLIVIVILYAAGWIMVTRRWQHQEEEPSKLPPGPKKWPVVGNIFQLGVSPHESFAKLARKHGPIMTLWLGSMQTVVISSTEVAREMFKNHDIALAGRKVYEAIRGDNENEGSLITAQYGPKWRALKQLITTEFFVSSRIQAMQGVRSRCVGQMLKFIKDAGESGKNAIDLGRFFHLMSFNLIGNVIFSKDLLDPKSEKGAKFFYHVERIMELAAKPNVADFWPALRHLDPQGIRSKSQYHVNEAFKIVGEFLKQRMESPMDDNRLGEEGKKDYLDVLLDCHTSGSLKAYPNFCLTTINAIVLEMFVAGSDTTASTLEWVMAELLRHPSKLEKTMSEVRNIVSPGKELEEKDLDSLVYLDAVIKETLRLHPPLPLLVPHKAMVTCNMLGFRIPKETQILVNVWGIGRDPQTWEDPLEFKPERFLESSTLNYRGQHFEYLPFGSGRRMCPAIPLASRVLPLALGSVLLSFNCILADNLIPEELDMSEKIGITLRKAKPLKVIAVPNNGKLA